MYPPRIENFLAFIALVLFILTLTPSIIRVVYPGLSRLKVVRFLTKYRREVGILTWLFGLLHGTAIVIVRKLDFTHPKTYITYFQGLTLLTIFTLLAVTSNDLSVKKLKNNWKKLHRLSYLALFILPWHVYDKMYGHWTWVTPLGLGLLLITIYYFCVRWFLIFWKKYKKK